MRTTAFGRAALVIAIGTTALLGCGGDDDASSETTEAVEETTTTTEETTTTTEAVDPAQQYYDMSAPGNCVSDRIAEAQARVAPDGNVTDDNFAAFKAEVLSLYLEAADALENTAEGLRAATWPADVQPEIEAVAVSRLEYAAYFRELALVSSTDELGAFYETRPAPSDEAVAAARAKFGLPAVDSPENQAIDWCAGAPQV